MAALTAAVALASLTACGSEKGPDGASTGQRIVDIPDTVDLKDFGLSNTSVKLKGGPVTKIDHITVKKLQVVHVGAMLIGITYEPRTGQVGVAMYSGTLDVYDDNKTAS